MSTHHLPWTLILACGAAIAVAATSLTDQRLHVGRETYDPVWVGLVVAAALGVAALVQLRLAAIAIATDLRGTTTTGTVTALSPTSTRVNGTRVYDVHVTPHEPTSGVSALAVTAREALDPSVLASVRPGALVRVRYLPTRPARARLLPWTDGTR